VPAADQPSASRYLGPPATLGDGHAQGERAGPICAATGGHLSHPWCAQNWPIRPCAPWSPARAHAGLRVFDLRVFMRGPAW